MYYTLVLSIQGIQNPVYVFIFELLLDEYNVLLLCHYFGGLECTSMCVFDVNLICIFDLFFDVNLTSF